MCLCFFSGIQFELMLFTPYVQVCAFSPKFGMQPTNSYSLPSGLLAGLSEEVLRKLAAHVERKHTSNHSVSWEAASSSKFSVSVVFKLCCLLECSLSSGVFKSFPGISTMQPSLRTTALGWLTQTASVRFQILCYDSEYRWQERFIYLKDIILV